MCCNRTESNNGHPVKFEGYWKPTAKVKLLEQNRAQDDFIRYSLIWGYLANGRFWGSENSFNRFPGPQNHYIDTHHANKIINLGMTKMWSDA